MMTTRALTRAALAHKRANGERVGAVRYGYRLAADGVHEEVDPAEARVVALVRELRAAGLSLRAIGARLTEAGHTPRGGSAWHPDTIARLMEAT
jgi:DNA invertase Pin-like site-specific DNA recombinase